MCYIAQVGLELEGPPSVSEVHGVPHLASQIKEKNHFLKFKQKRKILSLETCLCLFCFSVSTHVCTCLGYIYIHIHVCRSTCAVGKCCCIYEHVKG